MATFVPPIAGAMTGLTVDRPTRGVVDDTGHRVALISRFAEPANVTAVAPARAHARLIQVDGQFPDAAPADAGRVYFVELSPLASATNEVLRRLGDAGATMPTFYVSGPNLVATMPSGVVDAGDTLASGAAVLVGATLGPCALAPREWARVLRDAMAGAGEDVASWADFLAALGNEPALYILQHTGQPPAPGQMHFDVDPGNGNIQLVTIDAHGDLAVAASPADVFAPGARIRLRGSGFSA